MSQTRSIIEVSRLSKIYKTDIVETIALDDVSFTINKGEFVAIMGPSGSGKSTLMHILGALDRPTSGTYILDGENVEKLSDDELADIRNRKIGFIFQAFNLLPRTTTMKNVTIPMMYAGIPKSQREATAKKFLEYCHDFGRSATACSNCPCARFKPVTHPCRRTDRKYRHRTGGRNHGNIPEIE